MGGGFVYREITMTSTTSRPSCPRPKSGRPIPAREAGRIMKTPAASRTNSETTIGRAARAIATPAKTAKSAGRLRPRRRATAHCKTRSGRRPIRVRRPRLACVSWHPQIARRACKKRRLLCPIRGDCQSNLLRRRPRATFERNVGKVSKIVGKGEARRHRFVSNTCALENPYP